MRVSITVQSTSSHQNEYSRTTRGTSTMEAGKSGRVGASAKSASTSRARARALCEFHPRTPGLPYPSHRAPRSLSLTPPSGKGMLVRKHVNCSPSLHPPCPGRIWGPLAHPAFTSRSHLTCSPLPLLSARQRAASLPGCPPPRWPLVPRPAQPRKTRMT